MRMILVAVFFFHTSFGGYSQNNSFANEKAKAIVEIINKVSDMKKINNCLVVANLGYKSVRAERGTVADLQISDRLIEDTIAVNYIRELVKHNTETKKRVNFKTFKEVNFNNRYKIINSSLFSSDTHASEKNKLYIEINEPIDGWEICKLFTTDSVFSGEAYMQYYIPKLYIPVGIFSIEKDEGSFKLLLFEFQMAKINGKFVLKLVNYKLL
jgi:hypothetical protein